MTPGDIYRKLVLRGSDGLVRALYERIRADDGTARGVPPVAHAMMTWRDLAEVALTERVLTPPEARLLWAIQSGPQA